MIMNAFKKMFKNRKNKIEKTVLKDWLRFFISCFRYILNFKDPVKSYITSPFEKK